MSALILLSACATRTDNRPRPTPTQIERNCERLSERVRFRDERFVALRGSGQFEVQGSQLDAQLAVARPHYARIELTGPLGVRVAMLVINPQWLQLFIPREKKVLRFPMEEFKRDTLRRERFLKRLPFPIVPELFFDALLTRVGVGQSAECDYDAESNAYRLRFASEASGGRWAWVDPGSFAPLEVQFFSGRPPALGTESARPLLRAQFSSFAGDGIATLPRRVELSSKVGPETAQKLAFEWRSSELWSSFDPKVFEWQPAASILVEDF